MTMKRWFSLEKITACPELPRTEQFSAGSWEESTYDGQQNRDTDRLEHLAWGDKQNILETNVKCYPEAQSATKYWMKAAKKTKKVNAILGSLTKPSGRSLGENGNPYMYA